MKKTGIILLYILGLALVVKVTWGIAYPSGTWRYKMTVEVETPEGVKTGSAVREVSVRTGPKLWSEGSSSVKIRGEAVVINLGKRGTVFALLDQAESLPSDIFYPHRAWRTAEGVKHMRSLKNKAKEINIDRYPRFVRFRDLNDPKTVENLLDMRPCTQQDKVGNWQYSSCLEEDHFNEVFGEGVRLKSVAIEMTDEEVTFGTVKRLLPWLNRVKGYIDGQFLGGGPELSSILDKGDFVKGDMQ